jgi:hypothetical protein
VNYDKAIDAHRRADELIECLNGLIGDMVNNEEGPNADEDETNASPISSARSWKRRWETDVAKSFDARPRRLERHDLIARVEAAAATSPLASSRRYGS